MSIAVLADVYTETRRLAIAGSVVAPGDFRLEKLIAPLKKSGEKAPVFAKVAELVQRVVESSELTASEALSGTELIGLLYLVHARIDWDRWNNYSDRIHRIRIASIAGQCENAQTADRGPHIDRVRAFGADSHRP